jgi:hypothetical protein
LIAGWLNEDGSSRVLHSATSGTISSVTPLVESDDDNTLTFNVKDGKDYDSIKAIKIKKSKRVRKQASQKELTQSIKAYNKKRRTKYDNWKKSHPKATAKQISAQKANVTSDEKKYATNARSSYNKAKKYYDDHKKYEKKTVYEYMSFKKNTKASTIIKAIAKKAGIDIDHMNLAIDHVYLNGYTAKDKPMACIRAIAKTCTTDVIWPHGKLVIENIKKNRKRNIHIEKTTGLLSKPIKQTDGDGKQWQVTFLYRTITVGDVFYIKHDRLTGWVIALSGTNAIEIGGVPTTTVICELFSDYEATEKKKINAQKKKDRTAKRKADKVARDAAKKKRQDRTKNKTKKKTTTTSKKNASKSTTKKSGDKK